MYFVQQWYSLADEAVEYAVDDSQVLRTFMGLDLSRTSVPDATTLMGFHHLLEVHDLTKAMLVEVNVMLMERGLLRGWPRAMTLFCHLLRLSPPDRNFDSTTGNPHGAVRVMGGNVKMKRPVCGPFHFSGGGGEIRTHERFPFAGFQDRCNRPLCHTSKPPCLRK